MHIFRKVLYFFVALLIGATHAQLSSGFWGLYVIFNPINDYLINNLLINNNYQTLYYTLIYSHDILVNSLLVLPFACLLFLLSPRGNWGYVLSASIGIMLTLHFPEPTPLWLLKDMLLTPTIHDIYLFLNLPILFFVVKKWRFIPSNKLNKQDF
jgi:hypothetical protein